MHNIQHMYSAAHLKTCRNTITPSLFTREVKQSDYYTKEKKSTQFIRVELSKAHWLICTLPLCTTVKCQQQ